MTTKPELSVIIPCYNEGDNIPLIFNRLKKIFDDRDDVEIILVNNGSIDNSEEIFKQELQKINNNSIKIINILNNQGYGYGILCGLNKANGNLLSWTHADMQTDPHDIIKALDLYKDYQGNKIIIKGKRQKRKLSEAFFTFGMQIIVFFVLKIYLDDINSQPKLFSKNFYNKYIKDKSPNDFSLDLFLLYQAKINKYKILEVPVFFKKRLYGEAKGGGSWKTRIKLIKRTFKYIFELKSYQVAIKR